MKVAVGATEYVLPGPGETSEVLKAQNPDWRMDDIEKKTGVLKRHVAAPGITAVDLAEEATRKLLDSDRLDQEPGFLILVTQSPDYVLPTSACVLQDRLKLPRTCMAFDVNLGCSGFVYALAIAGGLIETGVASPGLVVCAETYSHYIGEGDRTTRPLFSDAASATWVEASDLDTLGPFVMGSDGAGCENLIVYGSGARGVGDGQSNGLHMDGSQVFMFTMDMVPKCVEALLDKADLTSADVDQYVFHQASKLVIDNIVRRLDLEEGQVFRNYAQIGNTVSASIPIALKDAIDEGRIRQDDTVMLVGFGVGYSWGGCLLRGGFSV